MMIFLYCVITVCAAVILADVMLALAPMLKDNPVDGKPIPLWVNVVFAMTGVAVAVLLTGSLLLPFMWNG